MVAGGWRLGLQTRLSVILRYTLYRDSSLPMGKPSAEARSRRAHSEGSIRPRGSPSALTPTFPVTEVTCVPVVPRSNKCWDLNIISPAIISEEALIVLKKYHARGVKHFKGFSEIIVGEIMAKSPHI